MRSRKDPIIVTGLPRSGTSLTAGCLHACGAWVGNVVEGLYENKAIREDVVKKHLHDNGFDSLGVNPIPRDTIQDVPNLRKKILKIIKNEGYDESGEWLYKEAKILLMSAAWRKEFPSAKWIMVRRDPSKIVNSCLNTPFMSAHSPSLDFWNQWVRFNLRKIEEVKNNIDCIEVWPQKIIEGDLSEIKGAALSVGLEWDESAVKKIIHPERWSFS